MSSSNNTLLNLNKIPSSTHILSLIVSSHTITYEQPSTLYNPAHIYIHVCRTMWKITHQLLHIQHTNTLQTQIHTHGKFSVFTVTITLSNKHGCVFHLVRIARIYKSFKKSIFLFISLSLDVISNFNQSRFETDTKVLSSYCCYLFTLKSFWSRS